MKRRIILFLALLVPIALALGIGAAVGTPGQGAVSSYIARGVLSDQVVVGTPRTVTITRTVRVKTKRGRVSKRVKFQVPSPQELISCGSTRCDTVFQVLTIAPGGYTGWHTHPGPTFVAVTQGEGTMYRGGQTGCTGVKYAVGSAFLQPSTEVHNMRNEGSTPLVLHAFYILPPATADAAIRVDQPQPTNCPTIQ